MGAVKRKILAWLVLNPPIDRIKYIYVIDGWLGKIFFRCPPAANGTTLRNTSSIAGILAIFYGVFALHKGTPFPGAWGLVPTLAAVLLIAAGPAARINRFFFSNPIAVWFGLISYPLYLWHYPLLSFARILEGETPSWYIRAGAILAAIALAWLTYMLVEKPVRFGGFHQSQSYGVACAFHGHRLRRYNDYMRNGLDSDTSLIWPWMKSQSRRKGKILEWQPEF